MMTGHIILLSLIYSETVKMYSTISHMIHNLQVLQIWEIAKVWNQCTRKCRISKITIQMQQKI